MKIGILTYHRSINYGSVLQTWATQNLLEKEGYSAEIIDYEPEYHTRINNLTHSNTAKNRIKNLIRRPIIQYKDKQQKAFEQFRNKYLHLSHLEFSNDDNYKSLESYYDCIICGSDQIWNVHALDCDDIYFLPDINLKKIALAVSVNNTDFTESRCDENMRRWISEFDFLSCREENGSNKIRKFLNDDREVYTFLDPTLMHEKDDYYPLCSDRIIDESYIFMYKVWSGSETHKLVSEIGKKLKKPVYTLLMTNRILSLCKLELSGIKIIKDHLSPSDYLSLINYADFIVTDSFHGTAFSLIFEKQFICVREKTADGSEKKDERLTNILKLTRLENRYIALNDVDRIVAIDKIDYETVTRNRMKIAKNNIDLLRKAIETPFIK